MATLWQQIQSNLVFLGICLGIFLALMVLAKVAEHFLPDMRKTPAARRVSIIGVCAAIAAVVHMLDFPLLFLAPEFYKVDFSELPVMLCGFYLGPSATVVCEAVKILVKLLFKGTSTAFVGDFANFVIGCALVLPASIVYHIHKSKKSAVLGLILGVATMTVFGSIFNGIYLLPKFAELYGMPLEAILAAGSAINVSIHDVSTFVIFAVAPLNLLKGTAVAVLTMLLYKRVAKPLFAAGK
ncbi:MAG TPA: ECF transporter S component [Candidatus Faecousia intestinigallinarum]|nr:ECF transporter S component [Candidatus Faecousia intestinigallinarum]